MKCVNKVTLLGIVGRDPEIRYTAQGLCVASFSFATSEKRKDKDPVTQWHNCVAFGKLGEIVAQYVTKGSKMYVEGAIDYQAYEKDGEKRYTTKIVLNEVSLLSGNDAPVSKPAPAQKLSAPGAYEAIDDDIPF